MDYAIFLIPVFAALIPGAIGFRVGRSRNWGALGSLYALLGIASLWMVFEANRAMGYDALGWVMALYFLNLPAAIGMGLGAVVGAVRADPA